MWVNGARKCLAALVAMLAFVVGAFAPHQVFAKEAKLDPAATYSLEGNLNLDLVATGAFTTSWIVAETVLKKPLSPDSCRWCQSNGFDSSVRDSLRWNTPQSAANISNIGTIAAAANAFGTLALLANASDHPEDLALNSLYVLESVSVTMTFTNLVKVIAARQRPAIHYQSDYADKIPASEENLSFFSGHSALTFSLVSAAGSVAVLRGYRYAPWLWSVGLGVAAVTAYARIGADAHYATDVFTGATVGTLLGAYIPRWLHPRQVSRSLADRQVVSWQPLITPTAHSGALLGIQGTL
jgi:membrane-associated phospholipid phosphatase